MSPRGFGARGEGLGGTNGVQINTDDLVADIARARDAATGDMKRLLKRCGRRIEKLEICIQDMVSRAAQTLPTEAEDEG